VRGEDFKSEISDLKFQISDLKFQISTGPQQIEMSFRRNLAASLPQNERALRCWKLPAFYQPEMVSGQRVAGI
jgi:hypothetical protein